MNCPGIERLNKYIETKRVEKQNKYWRCNVFPKQFYIFGVWRFMNVCWKVCNSFSSFVYTLRNVRTQDWLYFGCVTSQFPTHIEHLHRIKMFSFSFSFLCYFFRKNTHTHFLPKLIWMRAEIFKICRIWF